ncbi:uncharacterized protein STEHIDRAFT_109505 [Stereum hirsutum FP-91666 SS1]|uniref:uncharacterized protein n=1 Tax=Stereum hirsutum (strain FP-91666) TaxID=721885 RepID=UPI000440E1B4|nr:uncharacterized protein STEHIDRAFT_109505 [Stereum hirsutum FP-91666 SS1]EIM89275.1 hypothetical protein STEHIDRAFT_109505 [Stereum hirsutum FP-91666 SS1]
MSEKNIRGMQQAAQSVPAAAPNSALLRLTKRFDLLIILGTLMFQGDSSCVNFDESSGMMKAVLMKNWTSVARARDLGQGDEGGNIGACMTVKVDALKSLTLMGMHVGQSEPSEPPGSSGFPGVESGAPKGVNSKTSTLV